MLMAVYAMNDDAKEGLILYAAAYGRHYWHFRGIDQNERTALKASMAFQSNNRYRGHPYIFIVIGRYSNDSGFLSKFYMLKAL